MRIGRYIISFVIGLSGLTNFAVSAESISSEKRPQQESRVRCELNQDGRYLPFNRRGIAIGGPSAGANTMVRCREYIATQVDNLMCSYGNSGFFMPYNIQSGEKIGSSSGGAKTLERCAQYLATKSRALVCSYTHDGNFLPFNSRTGNVIGGSGGGAKTLERCAQYVSVIRSGYVCSYDGTRFQIYDIQSSQKISRGGYSLLEDCQSSL